MDPLRYDQLKILHFICRDPLEQADQAIDDGHRMVPKYEKPKTIKGGNRDSSTYFMLEASVFRYMFLNASMTKSFRFCSLHRIIFNIAKTPQLFVKKPKKHFFTYQ